MSSYLVPSWYGVGHFLNVARGGCGTVGEGVGDVVGVCVSGAGTVGEGVGDVVGVWVAAVGKGKRKGLSEHVVGSQHTYEPNTSRRACFRPKHGLSHEPNSRGLAFPEPASASASARQWLFRLLRRACCRHSCRRRGGVSRRGCAGRRGGKVSVDRVHRINQSRKGCRGRGWTHRPAPPAPPPRRRTPPVRRSGCGASSSEMGGAAEDGGRRDRNCQSVLSVVIISPNPNKHMHSEQYSARLTQARTETRAALRPRGTCPVGIRPRPPPRARVPRRQRSKIRIARGHKQIRR